MTGLRADAERSAMCGKNEAKPAVRVLIVEDSADAAELMALHMRSGGLAADWTRVDDGQALARALRDEKWDAVIAGYRVPSLHGLEALEILKRSGSDIPFVLVSGTADEEIAANAMRSGACDFLLKQNLGRLAAVLRRELDARDARRKARQARHQLAESESRYRRLIEASPDAISVVVDGKIVFGNAQALKLYGVSDLSEVVGRDPLDFIAPEQHAMVRARLRKALVEDAALAPMEQMHVRPDGSKLNVEIRGTPFMLKGKPALLSVIRDITERKQAEEWVGKLLHAVERTPVAIVVTDTSGRIEWVNHRFSAVTGYTSDEAVGQTTRLLKSGLTPEEVYRDLWTTVLSGREWRGELQNRAKNGALYWEDTVVSPLKNEHGEIVNFIAIKEDITARKREEQLLALEHTVARCLGAAESAQQGLESVMRAVCETERWERATYWSADQGAGVLRFGAGWQHPGIDLAHYAEASRAITFGRGVGLAGRVWQSGEPLWSADFANDPRVMQRALARETGVRGMFVFPVTAAGKPVGVLAFFSREIRAPDERLLAATRVIGSQVGQFLMRMEGEESLQRFRAAMDAAADGIYLVDRERMRLIDINQTAARMLQRPRDEILALGLEAVASTSREELERIYDDVIARGEAEPVESLRTRPDGTQVWVEYRRRARRTREGWMIVTVARDITKQKRQARKLARLRRIRDVLGEINGTIVRVRERKELLEAACRIAVEQGGFRLAWAGQIDPQNAELRPLAWAGDATDELFQGMRAHLPVGLGVTGQVMKSGALAFCNDVTAEPDSGGPMRTEILRRGCRSIISLPLAVEGSIWGALTFAAAEANVFTDDEIRLLSELSADVAFALEHLAKQERLNYLAYYDSLTDLPNRALLKDRLTHQIRAASRGNQRIALAFLDLERLRVVNESLGREMADRLLKAVGARLNEAMFERDSVARLQADVFAVLLSGVADEAEVARIVEEKILGSLAAPFSVAGHEVRVAARAGIALYPDDGSDANALLGSAEAALRQAKSSRERYIFYAPRMNAHVAERLKFESRLRRAVERKEFVLHYQPKVELAGGRLTGVEALIRWNDPEQGLVSPGLFIPLLEETGMIADVGAWALRESASQYVDWKKAGLEPPRIAVNVSQVQLKRKDFVARVQEALACADRDSPGIDLEITESMVMEDVEANIGKLQAMRDLGMGIAIDDFGTGYSSLQYIARLPVTALKIDRAFLRHLTAVANDMSMVTTIISLARNLQLKVIAEGVETEEQAKLLRLVRCDEAQGYLYGKPVPAAEIENMLRANSGAAGRPRGALQ